MKKDLTMRILHEETLPELTLSELRGGASPQDTCTGTNSFSCTCFSETIVIQNCSCNNHCPCNLANLKKCPPVSLNPCGLNG